MDQESQASHMQNLIRIIAEGDIDALVQHANDPALQEYARSAVASRNEGQGSGSSTDGMQSGGSNDVLSEAIGALFETVAEYVTVY